MKLPSDVLRISREYDADKEPPTPTATRMKKVKGIHIAESNHDAYPPERRLVTTDWPTTCYGTISTLRNHINLDNELTGLNYNDAHVVRVYKNVVTTGILELITSPGGVATAVQGGSGINVADVASRQYIINNTAQGSTGPLEPTLRCKPSQSTMASLNSNMMQRP